MRKVHSKEEIEQKLASLPEDIKKFLYSLDFDVLIQQISAKNRLHIDQMSMLAAETNEVMTGFAKPEDFVSNLERTLQVERSAAETIAKDINEQVFAKIRESMRKASEPAPAVSPKPSVTPPPLAAATLKPSAPPAAAPVAAPSIKPQTAPVPATVVLPKPAVAQSIAPATPPAPKPAAPLAADLALSQKTMSVPKAPPAAPAAPAASTSPANKPPAPPQPGSYTADPYREPTE